MTSRCKGIWAGILALFFAAGAVPAADAPKTPVNWYSGVGVSAETDPRKAAEEAASKAKERMGDIDAKLVMVTAAEPQVTPELIEGVKKYFPADVIYGCQVTSPLTARNNFPDVDTLDIPAGVAVWAVGGDIEIVVATVPTNSDDDDVYYSAGIKLAGLLNEAVENAERPGRLIITWGDQYNGSNVDFADGLNAGFGMTWPIVGAAAGNITAKVIVKGKIVTGVNVGVLLAGEFKIGQAMNGGTHTPETADKTLAQAIEQGDGAEPFFALVFNCRRRRQGMMERNQLGEELEVIKKRLPGVDFFGFYGPGEIGASKFGEPAKGAGFTVVTAVLFAL